MASLAWTVWRGYRRVRSNVRSTSKAALKRAKRAL